MIISYLRGTAGAVIALALATGGASAATLIVTPATIVSTFYAAHDGDTLRLSGTFGNVRLQNRTFAKPLTIDASHAVFTDTLILEHDSGVTLSGGQFNIAGGSSYGRGVAVWGGSNIAVNHVTVAGNGGEDGVVVEGVTNATVNYGRFDGLRAGIGLETVTGGYAAHNTVTHAVADGIDIGDSHNVTATYNACSLGTPGAGVHPDCIQLWSVAGNPIQSDITVTRNTATGPTQGFTSFATGGGGLRLTITHNSVTSSYPQGIACYDCVDSTIGWNKVSTLAGSDHLTSINVVGGSNNLVIGNVINTTPVTLHGAVVATDRFAAANRFVAGGGIGGVALQAFAVQSASVGGVPEPATWTLLVTGFAAAGLARRRAWRTQAGRPA